MATSQPIQVILDLTAYQEELQGAKDFVALWNSIAPTLVGRTFEEGADYKIEQRNKGLIQIHIITLPHEDLVVTQQTNFAIYSVIEKPKVKHKCHICSDYGPFRCMESKKRVCENHVTILDGSMMPFSPHYAPKCNSGNNKTAAFWCDGPTCKGKIPWSESYRRNHPNDLDHWYCPDCYKIKFPKCSHSNCQETGSSKCEHVDSVTKETCNNAVCNRHVKRWQVYGPNKRGLSLCEQHRNIKRLSDDEILYQIIAGTVKRKSGSRKWAFPIPSLQSFRHIFMNTRKRLYELDFINKQIEAIPKKLSNNKFDRKVIRAINEGKNWRVQNLKRGVDAHIEGRKVFAQLQNHLRGVYNSKISMLAEEIEYSDYKPKDRVIFIRLDDEYRGYFVGRGGQNIKSFESALGIKIRFERM